MSTSKSQIKAVREYEKRIGRHTALVYMSNLDVSKIDFEKYKSELKSKGTTFNKEVVGRIKEFIEKGGKM